MTILSAQSIRKLCYGEKPLITPCVERGFINGLSYGLSSCSYDCRSAGEWEIKPGQPVLVSTAERFCFPLNVCGSVLDKSSLARIGISAMNTHLDPGWEGWLTVELVNLGFTTFYVRKDSPICQVKFEWLDEPTDIPYRGKYQNQENMPVAARDE